MEFEIDFQSLSQTFLVESAEHLSELEESLVTLETRPDNEELLKKIFRLAHTLKGSSGCLGFTAIAEFAHAVEDLLESIKSGSLRVNSEIISLLLRAVDVMRQMVPLALGGVVDIQPQHKALMDEIARTVPTGATPEQEEAREGSRNKMYSFSESQLMLDREEEIHSWAGRTRTLRVHIARLDQMLDLISEMAVSRQRLAEMLGNGAGGEKEGVLDVHLETDRLYLEMQELVMKIRMVPVGPIFRQYIRTVRDVASDHGKIARLVIEGEDVEVDTTVIEHLRDPLPHLIRNAIDHGLESPETRKSNGKNPCGLLTIRAYHNAGNIVIQLSDDGAGFNRKKIMEKARASAIMSDADKLTDRDIYRLVFQPGFSTAEAVTDMSGRGIGMDVVLRNIEALNGSVEIESQEGIGSTVTIRLPLTLAIIEGFAVGVGEETYVIPLDSVLECLELPPEDRGRADGYGIINLRGEALPYLRLRDVFGTSGIRPEREDIIVVRYDGGKAGLVVDCIFGKTQAVIKPLGKLFKAVVGVSGSTVLGNGRVALILDVPTLLRKMIGKAQAVANM